MQARYDRVKFLTWRLLFAIYHVVSKKPIENQADYEEHVGGFAPPQIDPASHLIDFVTGNQSYKVILATKEKFYEKGEPPNISLTIQNLTERDILLSGKNHELFHILLETSQGVINTWSPDQPDERKNWKQEVFLGSLESETINWCLK